jgi:hypothetical protein
MISTSFSTTVKMQHWISFVQIITIFRHFPMIFDDKKLTFRGFDVVEVDVESFNIWSVRSLVFRCSVYFVTFYVLTFDVQSFDFQSFDFQLFDFQLFDFQLFDFQS